MTARPAVAALIVLAAVAGLPVPAGANAGTEAPCGTADEVVKGDASAPLLAADRGGATILAVGGPRTLGREEWRPGSSYPSMLGVELGRFGVDAAVVNAGQDNPSAADSMARLEDGIAQHAPALVLWEVGLADAARYEGLGPVEDQLAAAIETIVAGGARPLLLDLATGPDDDPDARPPGYDEVVAATAARHGVGLLRIAVRRDRIADSDVDAEDGCVARLLARELVGGAAAAEGWRSAVEPARPR